MKRNKLYITSLLLASVLMFSSCSDFLNSYNPSAVTDEFYNTKEGQKKLLVDTNQKFRSIFNTGELQYYGTDIYMAVTEEDVERMFNGYDKTFNSTAPIVGGYWKNLYKIIQQSNILLNRCTPEVGQEDYVSITSQAKFFRALSYYYLVETFGNVPLLTEENKGVIESVERNKEADIYSFIINEMKSIRGLLPIRANASGQVSDAAITHFLGKLLLTRAYKSYAEQTDFTEAADVFEALIQNTSGAYSLQSSYAALFDENNQSNSEVIWSIQYGLDKNYRGGGNPQQSMFGFGITALEPDLFIKDQADYSNMSRKYWVNPKAHELFADPVLDSRYDAIFKREYYINNPEHQDFGKLGIYFPRWNDKSGMDNGSKKYYPFKENNQLVWYPQSTAFPEFETASDRMPIIHKFKDTKIQWGEGGSREDVIFRLGDTYLLCAEAYFGMGDNDKALAHLNTIRMRAASDVNLVNEMKLNSVSIDIILDERARELMGEHDRWFDLKRTGMLLQRVPKCNPFVVKYNNLNENHLLRPIPQDEINKVSGLTQNAGY